ncbi:MAG: DUF1853 family protein [Akkermansiaceae bacterium]
MRKIDIENLDHTQALLQCLRASPLLVDHLPEAVCFDRCKFSNGGEIPHLNYEQKLGHLYEDALEYLLTQSSEINLLGKSIQIFNEDRITLGELDYLLEDRCTGEFIHLELAVKFYLIRYDNGEVRFPGPDPRDNWLNKLARLQEHQLKLTQLSAAKKFLLDEHGITSIIPQQLIYGKLFDHYRANEQPSPPAMHPDCQRGTWKYLGEWKRESKEKEITIIPKHLWPVELGDLRFSLMSVSRGDFISEASQRCTMIWDNETNNTQFIAPDTWL